jgi:hypothetical protein
MFTGFWIYKEYRIMSLDTVLKIGNILRNSKEKMSFSKNIVSCPKDEKGCWPFCLCLPVDKDFNIIFDKASIVPENKRNSLFYLKYITSNNDKSFKYIYGDIYYSVKGALGKNGSINEPKECGYYRLAASKSGSSFNIGTATCKEIYSSPDFSPEEIKEFKQIRTGLAKELTLIERILKYAPAIIKYFENENVSSFKEYIENEDNLKNICCTINKENNKKKLDKLKEAKSDEELLLLNSASIFLHFSYEDSNGNEKSWYDFSNTLELVIREMHKKYVDDKNKERLVLKKSLWPTICSGDDKNDIQFPNFDLENRYKTRVFTESEIEDLFYGDEYAKKNGKKISDSKYKLIVLPCGDNLKAEDLKLFQEKRNEPAIVSANEYKDDLISSILEDSSTFTSFDFIFAKKERTKADDTYLMEISNITLSALNRVNKRNKEIADKVYAERNKEIKIDKLERNKEKKEDYSPICNSFHNLLGDVQMNNTTGKAEIVASKKYESHILKVLPLVYKEDYYNDPSLLHSFVANVESATRIGDGSFWCKILKYDLMFILSIQNNKQNKFMEITNSCSFKLGFKIGKMAQPLRKFIGSFEKNYVGLLSRRVSTKEDCIRFVTDLCQKLVMHDSVWSVMSAEVFDDLANISESEYDKDELSFGFLDGYFKYEPTDKKKEFQKRLEKIMKDYFDDEDLKESVSKLNLIVNEIKK